MIFVTESEQIISIRTQEDRGPRRGDSLRFLEMESERVEEDPLSLDRHETSHLGIEKSSEDLVSMTSFHI